MNNEEKLTLEDLLSELLTVRLLVEYLIVVEIQRSGIETATARWANVSESLSDIIRSAGNTDADQHTASAAVEHFCATFDRISATIHNRLSRTIN